MKSPIFLGVLIVLLYITPSSAIDVHKISLNRFATDISTLTSEMSPDGKATINSASNFPGEIRIIARESQTVTFEYRKILKTPDYNEAISYAEVIEVEIKNVPGGINLMLRAPNPPPWSGSDNSARIEGELRLPLNCDLDIESDFIDFTIEGPFRSISNKPSFAQFDIRGVSEKLDITTAGQNIYLRDISGLVSVTTNNADIRIRNMITDTKPARLKNERGDILIADHDGALDVQNSFGKIRINGARLKSHTSKIHGLHCPIKLEAAEITGGDLEITSTFENVDLILPQSLSASMNFKVGLEGEIHIVNLPVKPIKVERDRFRGVSGEGESNIMVEIEGPGNIEVEGIILSSN